MAEKFSCNETLDSVENRDPTVGVIGYVDQIIIPERTEGKRNSRCYLNNAQGRRIQITAWDENIQQTQKLINAINLIVHINGAFANIPKEKVFNRGNVPYELIIQKSTEITIKGNFEEARPKLDVKNIEFKECAQNVGQLIKIKGYISCALSKVNIRNSSYYVASITNGYYKLELRTNEDNPDYIFILGTCVEVCGVLEKQRDGPLHLKISNEKGIKKVNKKRMSFEKIMQGYRQCN